MPEAQAGFGQAQRPHALKSRCEELGFILNKEELDAVYQRFIALADRKKGLMDEEIAGLVRELHASR